MAKRAAFQNRCRRLFIAFARKAAFARLETSKTSLSTLCLKSAGVIPSGLTVAVAVAIIFFLSSSIFSSSVTKPEAVSSVATSSVETSSVATSAAVSSVVSVAVSSVATASTTSAAFSSSSGNSRPASAILA